MIRLFFSILTILLFYSSTGNAAVRDFSKAEHTWKSESNKAFISGKAIFEDGAVVINSFIIGFDKKYGCNPVFGMAFIEGNENGEYIETIPIEIGFLKLYVDDNLVYDGSVININYSNGLEFRAVINEEILDKITTGSYLKIELVNNIDIIYNLNNSKMHINKAKEGCSIE